MKTFKISFLAIALFIFLFGIFIEGEAPELYYATCGFLACAVVVFFVFKKEESK